MKSFSLPKDGGLIEEGLPFDILHSYERIPVIISQEAAVAAVEIADRICAAIKTAEAEGRVLRLGLTTGTTPLPLYNELVSRYKKGEVSFANVKVYSIDEYYNFPIDNPQSRNHKLREYLLSHVDIKEENIFIPKSDVPASELSAYCAKFDAEARDLDMLVVGLGENGEVGFNEAGASATSRTRLTQFSYKTRKRQARYFNGEIANTPKSAITVGISTLASAKEIILMAWNEEKAEVVKRVTEDAPSVYCPASLLSTHPNITFYADVNSSLHLTREVAPWLVGPCNWTSKFIRKAVVWLCDQVQKPILKLTQQDYLEHSLGELLESQGSFSKINIDVFNDLQHTITGWPGGKPNADDSTRPVSSTPYPKKVVIFSPHPDDDVISMGGTFIRLVEQGHDVHVAYETSGNVAVHDAVVLQHFDTVAELGFEDRTKEVEAIIAGKVPGEPEPRALLDMKAAIRRSEARSAVVSFGTPAQNVHFLNLPFYETGGIKKGQRTQKDIDIIKALLAEVQPHQIYIAGDLADPHGTHRVCSEGVLIAIEQLREEGAAWLSECHVWMYRGAWMEWEIDKVDMAVPLSPEEVIKKRHAIFRHLSQKDIVPFPGEDSREFWQRAEDRTQNTANHYNALGMAEYHAIEVFVRLF